jgi:hypothetical protein
MNGLVHAPTDHRSTVVVVEVIDAGRFIFMTEG